MARFDPLGAHRRLHLPKAGTCSKTGASRSSTPRSASRIAAVAVTSFVTDSHGQTIRGEA
jgi:hypothetical protein